MSLAVYTFLPGWKIIRKTRFCQCQWPQEPHYITRITPERTQNLNTGLTESFLVRVRTHTSAKLASRWSSYSCTQPELRKTMRNLAAFIRLSMGGKKKNKCQGQAVERFWTQSHYLCSLFFLGMCSFVFWRGKPRPMRREVKKRCEDGLLGSFSHETARSCGHILTPSLWKKAYNAFTVFFCFWTKSLQLFWRLT